MSGLGILLGFISALFFCGVADQRGFEPLLDKSARGAEKPFQKDSE
jgi:hypothetical protein